MLCGPKRKQHVVSPHQIVIDSHSLTHTPSYEAGPQISSYDPPSAPVSKRNRRKWNKTKPPLPELSKMVARISQCLSAIGSIQSTDEAQTMMEELVEEVKLGRLDVGRTSCCRYKFVGFVILPCLDSKSKIHKMSTAGFNCMRQITILCRQGTEKLRTKRVTNKDIDFEAAGTCTKAANGKTKTAVVRRVH